MTASFLRLGCAGLVALIAASPAFAQGGGRPDRPYRGLFGGGVGETEQSLSASASISTSFDNRLIAGDAQAGQYGDGLFDGRGYAAMSGGLSYAMKKDRVGMNASFGANTQYFPNSSIEYVPSYSGAAGGSLRVSRRQSLSGNYSTSLQPYNTLVPALVVGDPVLGQASLPNPTLGVRRETRIVQYGSLAYSLQLGRKATFGVNYGYAQSRNSAGIDTLRTQTASARFSRTLTRGLGVYIGYSRTQADVADDLAPVHHQNIDAGIDFSQSRGITITRRTRLTFGLGTAALTGTSGLNTSTAEKSFHLTGNAALIREIGRAWSASIGYNRGVGFVERFREPFLTDSMTGGVVGLLGRRFQVNSSVGVMFSDVGLLYTGNSYRSYSATAGIGTALTRYLSLNVGGSYYHYGFQRIDSLPVDLQRELGRSSITVSLSTWAPLYQKRGKGANASR